MADERPFISVRELRKGFAARRSVVDALRRVTPEGVTAVDGVSFELSRGSTLGIIGESGSGKTTLARCMLRLEEPDAGEVQLDGEDVTHLRRSELRRVRRRMQMVFQHPYGSLNPRFTVGQTLDEPIRVHGVVDRRAAPSYRDQLLDLVGLPRAVARKRPTELSGGQQQRVAIARSLTLRPEVIIADEPVSALDVSIQAQIVCLIRDLQRELSLTVIFIAHQLPIVAQVADDVVIMREGRIVESGSTRRVFERPAHPYTVRLIETAPRLAPGRRRRHSPSAGASDHKNPNDNALGPRGRMRCDF